MVRVRQRAGRWAAATTLAAATLAATTLAATTLAAATLAAATLAAGAGLVGGPSVALAAPKPCPAPVGTSPVIAEPGVAQQRLQPRRLHRLSAGRGVTVAVLDSGVDRRHPQLGERVLTGRDFLRSDPDGATQDCNGHGTAVASLVAAGPVAGTDFVGLAPEARILPVRISEQDVVDDQRTGSTVTPEKFAEAIRWAVDQKAGVLNLSVVLYTDAPAVRSAVEYAVSRNVVVVAAVGNRGDKQNPRPWPAGYPGVLGVGAVGPDSGWPSFSQHGDFVDVVAPGVDVPAAAPNGAGHQRATGTSFAAPFVAGTAALVRARFPELTAAQVVDRITATADPAPVGGPDPRYGHGIVNPYRALTQTVLTGAVRQPAAYVVPAPDPATVARQRRQAAARERALVIAGVGLAAALVAAAVGSVVPRGRRRRWRAPVA
jgi:type VII secretion-associated serine protease mycosin